MNSMSQEEMTEHAKHRKDLPLWRRAILFYLGGSWLAAILFFLIALPINAVAVSNSAVGLGGIALLVLGLPLILKIARIFIRF